MAKRTKSFLNRQARLMGVRGNVDLLDLMKAMEKVSAGAARELGVEAVKVPVGKALEEFLERS